MRRYAAMIMMLLVSAVAGAIPVSDVPTPFATPGEFVVDQGGVMGPEYGALITGISRQLRSKTGIELVVITVDTLNGLTVDDYAEQLFKRLGIGEKRKDNGVLVLLSRDDRKVRIEVGYGLESVLNDAKAGRLLDAHAVPFLHENQFGRGLYEGAKAVATTLAAATQSDLQLTDPVTWPAQPAVEFGASAASPPMGKSAQVLTMAIFSMGVLVSLMILGKVISFFRRQTVKGRKEAITQMDGLSSAAFALPAIGTLMVGYSEGVFWFSLLVALLPLTVDTGLWFALRWVARQVDRWRPQCSHCHQAMVFVRTQMDASSGSSSQRVSVGTATDLWRCPACGGERTFADTIYSSRSGGSGWSYSRPSSGSGRSGGGSSGGGGASRGF